MSESLIATSLSRRREIRRLRALVAPVLARYGIEPQALTLLGHWYNSVFAITAADGQRYVLRVDRRAMDLPAVARQRVETESELWWLDKLHADLDLPVPEPVHTLDASSVVGLTVEGETEERVGALFRWTEGRLLYRGLRPAHLQQVGRLTAQLHNHSERLSVPDWFCRPQVARTDAEIADPVIHLFSTRYSPEAGRTVRATYERIRRVKDDLGDNPAAYGLIHADIHQRNYLLHRGKVRLIDFDDSGWGHRLYDLAVTIQQLKRHPHAYELRQALLDGYRQVRDLSAAQEKAIAAFATLRELEDTAYFLEDGDGSRFPDWRTRVSNGLHLLDEYARG